MVDVEPFVVGGFGALVVGVLLLTWGLYARRHGRLRNREGAAVLAGAAAVIGILVFGVGVYALLSA